MPMYHLFYVKSNYSLLSSLLTIDDIITYQKKIGSKYASICDDNMYGTMEFIKKCQENELIPIIGLEIHLADQCVLAIVEDYQGYQNLIKLSTLQNINKVTIEDLTQYQDHLFFLLPFASINLYQELTAHLKMVYVGYANKEEQKQALNLTDQIVFLPECLYLHEEDQRYLEYLWMIRDGKTIHNKGSYHTIDKMLQIENVTIKSDAAGLHRSLELAARCRLVLPKASLLLPIYDCPHGSDTVSYLNSLAKAGLSKRLQGQVTPIYQQRLQYELDIIHKMGFSNYFLVVYDFIRYAKKNDILVGPGRGSAAGSLVAYALGITDIDPITYDLLFERFLNPERVSMPDIDTDLPDIKREQVIQYVRDKYGEKRVAGIVTFATLAAKQVIRDVGRILLIPTYKIDKLTSFIPAMSREKLTAFYQKNQEFRQYIEQDNSLQQLYQIAIRIEGFPRQIGTHAAGIVMCQKDLDEVVPLTISDNLYLTSYSMNYLEELGLLKMDFLGIKNLSMIMNILQDIKTNHHQQVVFSQIPLTDEKTYALFTAAETTGIFQFESAGMRNFLRKLKPRNFEDIVAAIALFRPGPAANIDTYIARREGKEKVVYADPCLEPILKKTYGIMIYQEQIMQVASRYAGYSLGEADILRRAISKKKVEVLQQEETKFLQKAKQLQKDETTSKQLFQLILKFAGYGFNRSHAVAYSLVAYKMAYLKVHYPKEFYANMLTNVIGVDSKTQTYLSEVRHHHLIILKPDINRSSDRFLVTAQGILFPFASIKGIGVSVCETILAARRESPFANLFDAFSRLVIHKVTRHQLELLTLAGCFLSFGYTKKTIMENLDALINYAELTKDLDPTLVLLPEITPQEEYDLTTLLEQEKTIFGFYISNHPVTAYKKDYPGTIALENIEQYFNRNITVLVMIEKIKVIETKKQEQMAFITGSDETRTIDFTLFPKLYQRYKDLQKGDICYIRGTVEKRLNQTQMIIQQIEVVKGVAYET